MASRFSQVIIVLLFVRDGAHSPHPGEERKTDAGVIAGGCLSAPLPVAT
jgi:hypothetical protein